MTTNKAQKKAIRARMQKTGERYTAARQHLVADGTANGAVTDPVTDVQRAHPPARSSRRPA